MIFAIKERILKLNLLTDPGTVLGILNTINKNVYTDINLLDSAGIISIGKNIDTGPDKFKHYVISTENVLYQTKIDNIYVLLPKNANFDGIKQVFTDVLK